MNVKIVNFNLMETLKEKFAISKIIRIHILGYLEYLHQI